jgi:DNA-directed RNA polymerase alpha subunit
MKVLKITTDVLISLNELENALRAKELISKGQKLSTVSIVDKGISVRLVESKARVPKLSLKLENGINTKIENAGGLPPRIVNSLKSQNIFTIKDLTQQSKSELGKARGFGPTTMKEINDFLLQAGFDFKKE